MPRKIEIFDTTLRDGEQTPGISLNVAEKLEIARQLERLSVDVIEAGFPIASKGDFNAVKAIAENVKGPVIAALARANFKDIDYAAEALKAARKDAEEKMALWKQSPDKTQLPASVQMSRKLVFAQPPQVLDAALRVPEKQLPAWTVVDLGAEGVALVKVNKVLPIQISEQELNETESQFGNYWGKAEADAYYRALKRQYKVEFVNEGKTVMEKTAEPQKSASAS